MATSTSQTHAELLKSLDAAHEAISKGSNQSLTELAAHPALQNLTSSLGKLNAGGLRSQDNGCGNNVSCHPGASFGNLGDPELGAATAARP